MNEGLLPTYNTTNDGNIDNIISFLLPAVMTIETAEQLAADLKQLSFAEKANLTLDASQVETITSPGLQILVSLEKTLTALGGVLTIEGRRDAFVRALKDTGLESVLVASS